MESSLKLFLIEYSDIAPRIGKSVFEAVGFHVTYSLWGNLGPNVLIEEILPDIDNQHPNVIVFFFAPGFSWHVPKTEPAEWLSVCEHIRKHYPQTKIVAFFGLHKYPTKQCQIWQERYDLFFLGPVRIIDHPLAIKQLLGGTIQGFEGCNYYLHRIGWTIRSSFLSKDMDKNLSQPDAVGMFSPCASPIKTRLIEHKTQKTWEWGKCIEVGIKSALVYVTHSIDEWQTNALSSEIRRLSWLSQHLEPGMQLLIGANFQLLNSNATTVAQISKQAQEYGGWKLFITEHLWFEQFCPDNVFDPLVYQGMVFGPWEVQFVM